MLKLLTVDLYYGDTPAVPYEDGSDGGYYIDNCLCHIDFEDSIIFLRVANPCLKYYNTAEFYKDNFEYDINSVDSLALNEFFKVNKDVCLS